MFLKISETCLCSITSVITIGKKQLRVPQLSQVVEVITIVFSFAKAISPLVLRT